MVGFYRVAKERVKKTEESVTSEVGGAALKKILLILRGQQN
jgi:hypothetical protein